MAPLASCLLAKIRRDMSGQRMKMKSKIIFYQKWKRNNRKNDLEKGEGVSKKRPKILKVDLNES